MPTLTTGLSSNYSFILSIIVILAIILFYFWRKNPLKNLSLGGSATPTLNQFARDLTVQAAEGKLDPVIGRQAEIERVIQILCRRTKNNPVLVGKAGVGKTAIAEGLAQAIVDNKTPQILQHKKVLALDLPALLAGTKYRGEFEQRLKKITQEITAAKRNIILFIDEIHTLAEAGGAEGAIDADDILKPALARGDLQVIGATTAQEYKEFIKKDVTLDRRLHPILIDEPNKKETVDILKGIKRKYEQFHKVKISDAIITKIVDLAAQNIKDKSFPDKAIDLMDEAASKISIENIDNKSPENWPEVGEAEIETVMKEWQESAML